MAELGGKCFSINTLHKASDQFLLKYASQYTNSLPNNKSCRQQYSTHYPKRLVSIITIYIFFYNTGINQTSLIHIQHLITLFIQHKINNNHKLYQIQQSLPIPFSMVLMLVTRQRESKTLNDRLLLYYIQIIFDRAMSIAIALNTSLRIGLPTANVTMPPADYGMF